MRITIFLLILLFNVLSFAMNDDKQKLNNFLHAGIKTNNIKFVNKALAQGIDINYLDGSGYTPLMRATECGHTAIVKHLIECGASKDLVINNADVFGLACLTSSQASEEIAVLYLSPKLLNWKARGINASPFAQATEKKFAKCLLYMLGVGYQVKSDPEFNKIIQYLPAALGIPKQVDADLLNIIVAGEPVTNFLRFNSLAINLDKQFKEGMTLLMWAVLFNNSGQNVSELLSFKYKPNIMLDNNNGETALCLANKYDRTASALLLSDYLNPTLQTNLIEATGLPAVLINCIYDYLFYRAKK